MKQILRFLLTAVLFPSWVLANEQASRAPETIEEYFEKQNAKPPEDPAIQADKLRWQERLKEKPNDAKLNYQYADFCRQINAHEEAKTHLDKALEIEPANIRYMSSLAGILMNLKEYARAAELTQKLLVEDPQNPWFYSMLAEAQHGMGKIEEAIASSRMAVRLRPKERVLRSDHVSLLRKVERTDDLLKFIEESKVEDPGFPNMEGWKFAALKSAGRDAEALEIARKIAEAAPQDVRVLEEIAMLCDRLDKFEEADQTRAKIYELARQGKATFFVREQLQRGPLFYWASETLAQPGAPTRLKFTINFNQQGSEFHEALISLEVREAKGESREPEGVKPGDNYYLLFYCSSSRYGYLETFAAEPSYREVRQIVLDFVDGKRELKGAKPNPPAKPSGL